MAPIISRTPVDQYVYTETPTDTTTSLDQTTTPKSPDQTWRGECRPSSQANPPRSHTDPSNTPFFEAASTAGGCSADTRKDQWP